MKHIFVINPSSGSDEQTSYIKSQLENSVFDYEIYVTESPRDASRYVRERCSMDSSEMRFYACGGDGTLNEVVNGAVGFPHASVSCYPCGSGNDFVKYYGGAERFRNINALCSAPDREIDLIRINGNLYSVNIVNFGFDAYAVKTMNSVRRKPIIGGKNAYNTGIAKSLLFAMKNRAEILVDGKLLLDGNFLLCTVANGKYIGGKYLCAPRAVNDDGALELCLVKTLSVFTFAPLIKLYEAGVHLESEKYAEYIEYRRCGTVQIRADKPFILSVDGEIYEEANFMLEVIPKAIKFGVPNTEL